MYKLFTTAFSKKTLISIGFLLALTVFGTLSYITYTKEAKAFTIIASSDVHGYAWSSTIGWISLNCAEGGLPTTTGGPATSVCGSTTNYKVTAVIPSSTPTVASLTGYAWSSTVGWLSFNSGDVSSCGVGVTGAPNPGQPVRLDLTTRKFTGWARFITTASSGVSGWDGCLSFNPRGTSTDVTYVPDTTPNIVNYAWGSTVVGWVGFYGTLALGAPTVDLKINYGGTTNDGPVTMGSGGGAATLSWTTSNATSCTGTGLGAVATPAQTDWSSTTLTPVSGGTAGVAVAPNTGTGTVAHTYRLTCTNGSATAFDEVTVNVTSATAPYLELLVNGSRGPITIDSGSSVLLTYTTQNIINTPTCSGTGTYSGWNTPKASSATSTPATYTFATGLLTTNQTFNIVGCRPVGGGAPLTATVVVNIAAPSCAVAPTSYTYAAPSGTTGSVTATQNFGVVWSHAPGFTATLSSPSSSGGFTRTYVPGTDSSSSPSLTTSHTNVGVRLTGTTPTSSVPITISATGVPYSGGSSITCTPATFTIAPAGTVLPGTGGTTRPPWIEI